MANNDEGVRGFGVTLQQIDDGSLHAHLGEEMQRLARELNDHALKFGSNAKGTLTLKLNLLASPNGTVCIGGDVVSRGVKTPRVPSVFWLTKGNNLTLDNPKQQRLPLRDVTVPRGEMRDLSARPNVVEV
jgi:hypothetical protein